MRALIRRIVPWGAFQRTWLRFVAAALLSSAPLHAQPPGDKPGEQIAYVRLTEGRWQVWVMAGDGSNARQLTTSPVDKHSLQWCPGNRVIRYRTIYGDALLYELSTGREDIEPSSLPVALVGPDGKPIPPELHRGRRGGARIRCGENGDFVEVTELRVPEGMPQGRAVVIQRGSSRNPGLGIDIQIVDNLQDTADMAKQRSGSKPASLDRLVSRGRIAYLARKGSSTEIWSGPVEQGAPEKLLELPARVRNLSWSPDGAWLVFDSHHEGIPQIYRLSADGSRLERLTDGVSPARDPAWSAGGR